MSLGSCTWRPTCHVGVFLGLIFCAEVHAGNAKPNAAHNAASCWTPPAFEAVAVHRDSLQPDRAVLDLALRKGRCGTATSEIAFCFLEVAGNAGPLAAFATSPKRTLGPLASASMAFLLDGDSSQWHISVECIDSRGQTAVATEAKKPFFETLFSFDEIPTALSNGAIAARGQNCTSGLYSLCCQTPNCDKKRTTMETACDLCGFQSKDAANSEKCKKAKASYDSICCNEGCISDNLSRE